MVAERAMTLPFTGRDARAAWLLFVTALGWTALSRSSVLAWFACGFAVAIPALAYMVLAHTPARTIEQIRRGVR